MDSTPNNQDSQDEEAYINLDLETAEQLVFAAGKPELAKALHYHAHGVRNLVQGEWGKSFVASLESIMERHLNPLSTQIGGLRGDTTALQAEFRSGLQGVQQTVSALSEAVDSIQEEVSDLSRRMKQSENDRKNIRERLARLEAVNDRLARIEAAMAAERGNGK